MTIMLNGSDLTVTQVGAVARHGEPVALAAAALETMHQARAVLQRALQTRQPVCGQTAGVAERNSFLLDPAQRRRFSQRLVLNHRIPERPRRPWPRRPDRPRRGHPLDNLMNTVFIVGQVCRRAEQEP